MHMSEAMCGCRSPQLSLIITSATLDGEKFAAYYDGCPVFNVAGRSYDVDIIHSKEMHDKNYRKAWPSQPFTVTVTQCVCCCLNLFRGSVQSVLTQDFEVGGSSA